MKVRLDDSILMNVEKPARYTGGEWNMAVKNPQEAVLRFAFCFPDIYEVGMSHLGMKILYHVLNRRDDTYCERVFAPWVDMEKIMRENEIPLFALETKDPVKDFDIVGFTLQYEMSYTNILNMLDLAGIPIMSADRSNAHPFVCAGGPCACNPEPLADFIDFFVVGEGEEVILEILDIYKEWKAKSPYRSRKEFLEKISSVEGVYVPSLYKVSYNDDLTVSEIEPCFAGAPEIIRKRIVKNLDEADFPEDIIVPFIGTVHDRIMLEMFRGCIRGCRFCQAGFIYRPVRDKKPETLYKQAEGAINKTGYEEISLVSLSTSDYSNLKDFTDELMNLTEQKKVNLSLPSLRIDNFSLDLMKKAQKVRKSGLTFAPEAGTQRLRDVINKGISEEDIVKSAELAFNGGWSSIKLYFMIGLPTETTEDIEGIARISQKIMNIYMEIPKNKRQKRLKLTVSAACFVPKPFTPFQWFGQDTQELLFEKQNLLRKRLREVSKSIVFNWHDARLSFLEAVLARGDRRLGKVLVNAWKKGCRFDGWNEHFDYNLWMKAFYEENIDPSFYANRTREFDEKKQGLPYHSVSAGKLRRYADFRNITDMFKIAGGFIQSLSILKKIKPDIVFSKGGFVSCPVVWASWVMRIPVVIHESDITPGLTNKLSMPFARRVCYTFPESLKYFSNEKSCHTGLPVREGIASGNRLAGLKLCGFSGVKPVLVIIGGSQGSGFINNAVRGALKELLDIFQICHICGKGNMAPEYDSHSGYKQFEYVDEELPDIFACADIFISRAGATVLYEILSVKKPALLIPLSQNASRGDQILNAESFQKSGCSEVLTEENMTKELLITKVKDLYKNRNNYIKAMKRNSSGNAAEKIIAIIQEVLSENRNFAVFGFLEFIQLYSSCDTEVKKCLDLILGKV